jgi:hypothetical protein
MQIKHYTIFNSSINILNWQALRDDSNEEPYFLPFTREAYIQKVDVSSASKITKEIIEICQQLKLKNIFSIGSGIAAQEYQLKKYSTMPIIVSDYSKSVNRLKAYNIFDDAIQLDVLNDPIPVDEHTLAVFPRIDTEFNNDQLQNIFQIFFEKKCQYIWFIPAELLSLKILAAEIKIALLSFILNKPRVYCGDARSISCFQKIWGVHYHIIRTYQFGIKTFILKRN